MPLEKQKDEIVNSLHSINNNMKEYTKDVETRLEKALLAMGGKEVARKYGFETMGAKNVDEFMTDDRSQKEYKDTQAFNRKLIKLQNHASSFVKSIKDQDTLSQTSLPKI